jgi:hypothetical protein
LNKFDLAELEPGHSRRAYAFLLVIVAGLAIRQQRSRPAAECNRGSRPVFGCYDLSEP